MTTRGVSNQFAGGALKSLVVGASTLSTGIAGVEYDLKGGRSSFSMQVIGLVAGSKVVLQGSLDGSNWVTLGSTVGYTSTGDVILGSTNAKPVQFVRLYGVTVSTAANRDVVGYIGTV